MMVVNTIGGAYAARFLVGVAQGFLYTFFNLYLQVWSPTPSLEIVSTDRTTRNAHRLGIVDSCCQSLVVFWSLVSTLARGDVTSATHKRPNQFSYEQTNLGSLIGSIISNYSVKLSGRQQYQIPLGASLVISVIFMLGGIFVVPESPRWLLLQNREDKARKSLRALKPKAESEYNINTELSYMKAAIDEEKRLAQGVAYMDVFRNPIDRRRTLLVMGASLLNPLTGINWHGSKLPSLVHPTVHSRCVWDSADLFNLTAYGTYMFQMAGIKQPFEQSVGLAATAVGFSIVTTLAITKMGYRRQWLVTGLIICAVCNIVMAATYQAYPGSRASGIVTITMFHVFNIGYIGMVLTFSRLTCGELPSQRLRALTLGFAFGAASLGEWVSSFIAPVSDLFFLALLSISMERKVMLIVQYFLNPDALGWNAKFAYLWAPGCVLGAIWVYFYLPEVKDRRLEEIDEMVR